MRTQLLIIIVLLLVVAEVCQAEPFRRRSRGRNIQSSSVQSPRNDYRYGPRMVQTRDHSQPATGNVRYPDWDSYVVLRMSPAWEKGPKQEAIINGYPWAHWEFVEGEEGWSRLRNPETGKLHTILHMYTWRNEAINTKGIREDYNNFSEPSITLDQFPQRRVPAKK